MQDKDIQKQLARLRNIRLTADEKRDGRKALLAYMEKQAQPSVFQRFLKTVHMSRRAFAGSLALLFVVTTSGVSYAAEQSLPGDVLYPVKVRVNEEIRSVFAVSQESQKAWDERRVKRRLEEVEILKKEERWTEEVEEMVVEFLDTEYEDDFLDDYFEDDFDDWFEEPFWRPELEEDEWGEDDEWEEYEWDEWEDEDLPDFIDRPDLDELTEEEWEEIEAEFDERPDLDDFEEFEEEEEFFLEELEFELEEFEDEFDVEIFEEDEEEFEEEEF